MEVVYMITVEQFLKYFWAQYILIEEDFSKTLRYVTLEMDNEQAYSTEYAKILLSIGSEVDIVCKEILKVLEKHGDNITDYSEIAEFYPAFCEVTIDLIIDKQRIQPWSSWKETKDGKRGAPEWWKSYNAIKHDRLGYDGKTNNWTKANQKNTLMALAGLIQLELLLYYIIFQNDDSCHMGITPLPGSVIFSNIDGLFWDNIELGGDYRFIMDQQGIIRFEGPLFYR